MIYKYSQNNAAGGIPLMSWENKKKILFLVYKKLGSLFSTLVETLRTMFKAM